ncbi:hypothetical protein EK904_009920, partial [Melospiza melodia maxima]
DKLGLWSSRSGCRCILCWIGVPKDVEVMSEYEADILPCLPGCIPSDVELTACLTAMSPSLTSKEAFPLLPDQQLDKQCIKKMMAVFL